ncbi:hypothetical protein ACIPSA_51150 [Streptomyces sp. NPDC086549]|uniref:hypothetical protein n=1 Tax=Streptomyces sp. NPDC086549 TaxID=3365752 RepID=UPI0038195310
MAAITPRSGPSWNGFAPEAFAACGRSPKPTGTETAAGRIGLAPGRDLKQPHPLWANPTQADRLKLVLDDLYLRGPR